MRALATAHCTATMRDSAVASWPLQAAHLLFGEVPTEAPVKAAGFDTTKPNARVAEWRRHDTASQLQVLLAKAVKAGWCDVSTEQQQAVSAA